MDQDVIHRGIDNSSRNLDMTSISGPLEEKQYTVILKGRYTRRQRENRGMKKNLKKSEEIEKKDLIRFFLAVKGSGYYPNHRVLKLC